MTVIAPVLPLLFTTLAYTFVDTDPSLFHPINPGVIICVAAPVVITSAIIPEPGVGSVVSFLLESLLLLVESVYKVTHAAADVCIFNNAYVFAAAIVILADALLAIEPVAAFADVLDPAPVAPCAPALPCAPADP